MDRGQFYRRCAPSRIGRLTLRSLARSLPEIWIVRHALYYVDLFRTADVVANWVCAV